MGKASEAILALHPVSFRYKKDIDPQGIPEFGLIAEEVEKVKPLILDAMQHAMPLRVPILVETGTGMNWLEAH